MEIAQAIADTINGSSNAPQLTDTYYTLPIITESEGKVLRVVNYYDDYAFLRHSTNAAILQYDNTQENIYGTKTNKTKGLLTGTRTYMLNDANSYTETAYYYDYRGRVIQQRSTNNFGGKNISYTAYSFTGQVLKRHNYKTTNDTNTPISELYEFSYDHAGRLAQILYTYNADAPIILSQHTYDELGRLACKYILNNLDSVKYAYNIRNQITRIKSAAFEENMYYTSQNLNYNLAVFTPSYNGNIAMNTWRHDGGQVNGYMYGYDAYNRLSGAQAVLNSQWAELGQYSEGFVYDKQGNITTIHRYNNEDFIDYLSLHYNGNQVVSIENSKGLVIPDYNTMHYQDLADETTEMGYDYNGNLIYDKDRGISTIQYNVLNLPDRIQYSNGNQTMHEYDALGNRVRTTYYTRKSLTAVPIGNILHPENNVSDYTITVDGFNDNIVYTKVNPAIYNGTTWLPKFVHNPEGMMRHYSYEEHYPFYFIKDHLGNIRETFINPYSNEKYLIQRMQYYPSGLPWKISMGAGEHPYRYNGKELVQMHGQDEYDSHARWYYPAICRTTTMDPLCEKYYNISPYAWCGNNFANAVDLNGMDTWNIDSLGYVVSHETHAEEDVINIVEKDNDGYYIPMMKDGQPVSIKFKYGTIESHSSYDVHYKSSKEDGKVTDITVDLFKVRGDENASKLFKFFSDNITYSTEIEYSWFQLGLSGIKGLNYISTGHEKGMDASGQYIFNHYLQYGYTIRAHYHSHPYSPKASSSDLVFANGIINTLKQHHLYNIPLFYIYFVKDHNFKQYAPLELLKK